MFGYNTSNNGLPLESTLEAAFLPAPFIAPVSTEAVRLLVSAVSEVLAVSVNEDATAGLPANESFKALSLFIRSLNEELAEPKYSITSWVS